MTKVWYWEVHTSHDRVFYSESVKAANDQLLDGEFIISIEKTEFHV